MKLPSFLSLRPDTPRLAPDNYRPHEYSGKGVIKTNLLPVRQDELNAKLAALCQARDDKINAVSIERDQAIAVAKSEYYRLKAERDEFCAKATNAAHEEYDLAEQALLTEYAKPPTREEIALASTPVNHVVRIPSDQVAAEGAA